MVSWRGFRRSAPGVLLAAASYAVVGELDYRSDRLADHPLHGCRDAPGDLYSWALALILVTFILSSAWFARSAGGRWVRSTVARALAAAGLGLVAGRLWYEWRMERGAECPGEPEWCLGWCTPPWWDREPFRTLMLFLMVALLSVAVGWVARRLPPRRATSR
jgi:hypothetical protein